MGAVQHWTAGEIPDQAGRTALVTGANSGVGFEVAKALAERGAAVVLGVRDPSKGQEAAQRIRTSVPAARPQVLPLDLASLASVRRAAEQLHEVHERLDLLINNAGVGWLPHIRTVDGFEAVFATNHLGHFALTRHVLDLMLSVPSSRVVGVTSPARRHGRLDFDDLQSDRGSSRQAVYSQSKLANLMFAHELQRRLAAAGAETIALAAHPGAARSNFNRHLPWLFRGPNYGQFWPVTHSSAMGALAVLRASIDPHARGGEYYAPSRLMEFKGYPSRRDSSPASHDVAAQRRLWEVSEELTAARYDFLGSTNRTYASFVPAAAGPASRVRML